jgi:hypothetical protein
VNQQGVPYDTKSIMQLPQTSFSRKSILHTIEARAGAHIPLGQLNGLTPIDIQEINTLYQCPNNKGEFL